MELWLIRHALPVRIDGGDGPADPELAPVGLDQARRLAEHWGEHPVDAVHVSPQRRAVETAGPLAAAVGCDPIADDGLREFDAHLSTYVPLEELRKDEAAWKAMVAAWRSPEAQEERRRFREGVVATIDRIAAEQDGARVAAVCHGGVINAYLSAALGIDDTIFFEPAYTSVSRVLVTPRRRQVVSINETPHLPGLVLPTRP